MHPCAGLINQQYSHIAAFALGAVLGAEIVLPPAAKRDSFAHYFSVFKEQVLYDRRCQHDILDTFQTWALYVVITVPYSHAMHPAS